MACRGSFSMQLFPEASKKRGVPSELTDGRNQRVAKLLGQLAERPADDHAALLEASTELLLAPFVAEAQEEGSIFTNAMSMRQKVMAYRMTLTDRIESARSAEMARALTSMRDYTVEAAERWQGS